MDLCEHMDDIQLIQVQTQVEDREFIQETLRKNNGNVVQTIMDLSNLTETKRDTPERSETEKHMDSLREIMDDKERVFHEVFSNMRKETT